MPHDAPALKLAATRGYGAEVIIYDRYKEDRAAIAETLVAERDATLIPPFDHLPVMAGQGTAALELIEDAGPLDALIVCAGGGGFLSGCTVAAKHLLPAIRVYRRRARTRQRHAAVAARRPHRQHRRAAHDLRWSADAGGRPAAVRSDPARSCHDVLTVPDPVRGRGDALRASSA